jgi:hypothetical protein
MAEPQTAATSDWFATHAPKVGGDDWFATNAPKATPNTTPYKQPSVWNVLIQPTDKTDKEYGGYTGASGVAGATIKGLDDVARGTEGAIKGAYDTIRHPIDAARGIAKLPSQVKQVPSAFHDINESSDPEGSYLNVIGDTASQGAGQALVGIGTEGLSRITPPVVRGVAKGINKSLKEAPGTIGMGVGSAIGGHIGGAPGAELGGIAGAITGKELLPKLRIPGEGFGLPNRVTGGPRIAPHYEFTDPGAPLPEHPGVFPGAKFPESPSPELLQARGLESGAATPPPEPSAALGRIASPGKAGSLAESVSEKPSTLTPTPAPKVALSTLKRQINDSLGGKTDYEMAGGKPLEKGKPIARRPQTNLKQQIANAAEKPAPQTPRAPLTDLQEQIKDSANPLPEGFTATPDSEVLKGYKYDSAKQQLTAITKKGESYTHAEVTPEEFKNFQAAKSKGTEWNKQIRANHVQVKKNGAPTKPIGPHSASPDDLAPSWSQNVEYLKSKKSARIAKPNPTKSALR